MDILDKLNERQKEAVLTTSGPVMVMAGAGSGKTRVLTRRIAHLIKDLGVSPYSILAVTFTNKAANEMKERVSKLIEMNTFNMWISTFHSFCAKFLRIELNDFLGYKKDFTIIDEEDSQKVLRDIIKDFDLNKEEYKPKLIKSMISKKKNLEEVDTSFLFQFDSVMEEYQKRLVKENLLDFDDLVLVTVKLLQSRPDVLLKYQNKFNYIMVDEFQDTNTLQYDLMKMLSFKSQNIFIVGDEDQSIYSFRGAKPENIRLFMKDFPTYKQILLEQNYRSTSAILNIANKVIDFNDGRIKKNLFTENTNNVKPVYYHAPSSYDEVMFVIDKIKELHKNGIPYNEIAIMYRANSLSRNFEDMLVRYQIPYVIYGGLSFFERKEIKDMVAYLRLMCNLNDDFSFKRIVNEPKRKIGDALISKLKDASQDKYSLFESIDYLEAGGMGYSNLLDFKFTILELIESLENKEQELTDIIDSILLKTGYKEMLMGEGEEGQDRLDNIKEFKSVLKEADEFYTGSKTEKIKELLSDLALRSDTDNKKESEDTVKLMTYHQAKGLEYKVCFMVAMEQGIFPSINSYTQEERKEERRICYVGITRAKEYLFLTNCQNRLLYGKQTTQMESQYIKEIGLDNLEVYGKVVRILQPNAKPIVKPEVKKEEPTSVEINVGDKVNHKLFGDGVVVEKNGHIISVAFAAPNGVKKLKDDHPSIRKI